MTKANVLRLYKHFCKLEAGTFVENDFNIEIPKRNSEETTGTSSMGKMTQKRIDLIKSDAQRHKLDLENKNPWLVKPQEEETKSKRKK